MHWPFVQTGEPVDPSRADQSSGNGLWQPLLAAAHKAGVKYLLGHRMTALHRESPHAGRVVGVAATHDGKTVHVRARKAVILATGGATSNVRGGACSIRV